MARRRNGEATKPKKDGFTTTREAEEEELREEVELDAAKFRDHVTNIRNLKTKSAEIRGKIGAAVKNAEEDYGVHRQAGALWIKLEGMTEEARDSFLHAFDSMRIALGRATQTELFADKGGASPGLAN